MDYKEIINFLEVLLCRLQNEGAGARKIDMVAEAMGMISTAEDEQTVRTQLQRVNELMESLYGTSKGGAGGNQVRPDRRSAPEIQFMENIKEITAAAHRECLAVGETFVSSAGELAGFVERDIHDLSEVKASYDDLTDARRLENRLNMIKKRYQNRLKGSKQTFIGELTAVYDAAMEKVKAKFTRPEAGSLQMTRKQLYERFDAGHDSFLMRSRNVGDSLDLAGDAFEKLGKRLGEKVAAAKRRATAMTALVLVISFAVWGLLLGTAGKKAYDTVTECIKLAETIQNPQELPDGTDVKGDIVKKVMKTISRELERLEDEKLVLETRAQKNNICECGCKLPKNVKFCPNCGKPTESIAAERQTAVSAEQVCICGAKIKPGQFMCMECGRRVGREE